MLPTVDISPLLAMDDDQAIEHIARAIDEACRTYGFFYATGHGIAQEHYRALLRQSARFFALSDEIKAEISMEKGGIAWRGWFPVEGELTSGLPDLKEGLYLGEELGADDQRVLAGTPLHGANLWPAAIPELRTAVEQYLEQAVLAAEALMRGMALALGLDANYFARGLIRQPTLLFRIFHYPKATSVDSHGVGEHSDYGLLTLLGQDDKGGLAVKGPGGWIDVPPQGHDLVINIGDMFERLTKGRYRSATHRVVNASRASRYSFPLFYDPGFEAAIDSLPVEESFDGASPRWDGIDVHKPISTYGEYLLGKISKVFPELADAELRID